MNKKKVDSILKGVAATGVALGGATVVQNADVVYAAEMQNAGQQEKTQVLGSESESASTKASESASTSGSVSMEWQKVHSASISLNEQKSENISKSLSASTSSSESASMSTADMTSQNASTSEKVSLAYSAYESTSMAFKQDDFLEGYFKQIQAQQKIVKEEKDKCINSRKNLSNQYYEKADQLAEMLVKYKLYQDDKVTKVDKIGKWIKKGGVKGTSENGYRVRYEITVDGKIEIRYAYFDYYTVDANDNFVSETDPNQADHLYVLQKTPAFKFKEKGLFGKKHILTYIIDENGKKIFYVDGKICDSVSGNDEDGYYYCGKKYDWDGYTERPDGKADYKDKKKGNKYFSESEFDRGEDDYNNKRKEFTKAEKVLKIMVFK